MALIQYSGEGEKVPRIPVKYKIRNRIITAHELARELGILLPTLTARIHRHGLAKALEMTKAGHYKAKRMFFYDGKERSVSEIARMNDMSYQTLSNRIKRHGFSEKILTNPIKKNSPEWQREHASKLISIARRAYELKKVKCPEDMKVARLSKCVTCHSQCLRGIKV